jgi:succinyl-diaminopimelate desuccinylase
MGTPPHGSSPVLGDSAILRLNKALDALARIWNDEPPIPVELKEALAYSEEMATPLMMALGYPERVEDAKKLLTHTSVNVGKVKGGTMINMVPDTAEAEVALCLAPGLHAAKALERVKELLTGCVGIELDDMLEFDSNFTSPNLSFIKALRGAAQAVTGSDPKPFVSTATSDAGAFRIRGIPTVCFGPGDITKIHNYDEYVDAKELSEFAKTYLRTAIEYCT